MMFDVPMIPEHSRARDMVERFVKEVRVQENRLRADLYLHEKCECDPVNCSVCFLDEVENGRPNG